MKLEDEIKQQKFSNEHHKLIVNLLFTNNWMIIIQTKHFKKFNITPQQYNILRILRGQHPNVATVMLLQERMIDRMSNASRLVEKLRRKGLVDRIINLEDRRRVDVSITKEGLNLLKKIDAEDLESQFKALSDQEAKELNYLLDKFRS